MITRRAIKIWAINFRRAGKDRTSSQRPIIKIKVDPRRRIFIPGKNTPFKIRDRVKAT
jgi:hypothetical protein